MAVSSPVDAPHHFQETDVTCGPAVLKMVLDGIHGTPHEEEEIARAVGTNDAIGTRQKVLARFIAAQGLRAVERHTTTTIEEVRGLLRTGHAVIVCYFLPEEGIDHYALVHRITKDAILLHDPWYGPETRIPIDVFDRHWFTDASVPTRRDRWLVAIQVPGATTSA